MALTDLFRTNRSKAENQAEKIKDYRNIVILQTLIICAALLLREIFAMSGMPVHLSSVVRDCLFLLFGGVYVLILWDLLRNFTKKTVLITILFLIIMGSYVLALFTVNPLYEFFHTETEKRPYLFIIHMVLFLTEAIVIYHAIFDIFAGRRLSEEKLWGSACIFLMIGICFGSLYDLINILNPGSMGVPLPLGLESYTACIAFSMTIIGGHEAYPNAIPLILNLSVIEAVWANLFVVLLVGRLLGQPDNGES
ncbi:MAG: hypothetical protein JWO58_860 [Chitinophagaceae bacterium]|nr:hypothetical protein [Chitinophagaceae bacterium]